MRHRRGRGSRGVRGGEGRKFEFVVVSGEGGGEGREGKKEARPALECLMSEVVQSSICEVKVVGRAGGGDCELDVESRCR